MNFVTRSIYELQETTLIAARAFGGLLKESALSPRNNRANGCDWRWLADHHHVDGFLHGRRADDPDFSHACLLGSAGTNRPTGCRFAGPRTGASAHRFDGRGRVGSAIAAELGSMTVSQQIDAMRALGTDPIRKLVAPRMLALLIALPLLTVLADVVGIGGGAFAATSLYGLVVE